MDEMIRRAAEAIKRSKTAIAFTGAGISVESGIPDFRSAGGLWDKYDPAIYASIDTFRTQPERCWVMLFEMFDLTSGAKPNPAHVALAELEEMGFLKAIITQNIDNLHQRGGSKRVIEYHGNSVELVCLKCNAKYDVDDFDRTDNVPPRCEKCDTILKPAIVYFGEMIPPDALYEASDLANSADVLIIVGTSAVVYPAAAIPDTAKRNGAFIIESNIEKTSFTNRITDVFLQGPSGERLPELVKAVKALS